MIFTEPAGQDTGSVRLVLTHADGDSPISLDTISRVTLTCYTLETQEKGVGSQRWSGDTSGQVKYVEAKTWEVRLSDFPGGLIFLEPGRYQFKHNSVSGNPPSGFYGTSDYFEVKAGDNIPSVQLWLNAAI